MPQVAPRPNAPSAVASGTAAREPSRAYLATMVDSGYSQARIADRCGLGIKRVRQLMSLYGLESKARPGVVPKPAEDLAPVHGVEGKQPAKLESSAEALRAVSIFKMGFDSHDRSVFSAANRATPNRP